jgi:Ca2+-binding EF-hand superfamily protein
VHKTRAVDSYEGNVNFNAEETNVNKFKKNNDLTHSNPNQFRNTNQFSNLEELKKRVIDMAKQRGGTSGIRGLRVMFKAMDRDRSKGVDPVEFKYAMRDYGVEFTEEECTAVFKNFDKDHNGKLNFDEFISSIRGQLNLDRLKMVHLAYNVLDKDGSGQVDLKDIRIAYDTSCHPDVIGGRKTSDEVLLEFMGVWEKHKKDGIVTIEEFEDYYKDISASIDRDDYFELMIRNA